MSNKFIKTALSCCVLLVTALQASGDVYIYRWLDADGGVHYSDRKPQNVESTLIKTSKRPAVTGNAAQSFDQQIRTLQEREQIEALKSRQQQEIAVAEQTTADYCKSLKANIETLTNNARVRIKGEDGELRYLTAEEMVQKRNADQQAFTEKCKDYQP